MAALVIFELLLLVAISYGIGYASCLLRVKHHPEGHHQEVMVPEPRNSTHAAPPTEPYRPRRPGRHAAPGPATQKPRTGPGRHEKTPGRHAAPEPPKSDPGTYSPGRHHKSKTLQPI